MRVPEPPQELLCDAVTLSDLAREHGLDLIGADREVVAFGTLTTVSEHRDRLLTYATSRSYAAQFARTDIASCVIHRSLVEELPPDRSALVTSKSAADAFYTIFSDLVRHHDWSPFPAHRGASTTIAASAVIHEPVVIGDGCVIMDNVVVLPRTYIGDRVVIKPNSTIGGDGFQLSTIGGHRRLVPHAGGVLIDSDVTIGSQTCVDRGLFGDMTVVGPDTHIDNLVYVAHAVRLGRACVVVACAEISGSVTVGDSAWLGPRSAVNPGLRIGEHAMIGTGSTVVSDIPPHAVAFGCPARVRGWRCACEQRLEVVDGHAECSRCGSRFELLDDRAVPV